MTPREAIIVMGLTTTIASWTCMAIATVAKVGAPVARLSALATSTAWVTTWMVVHSA
jgi:hypothetical protein